jgi:hypothetical protein
MITFNEMRKKLNEAKIGPVTINLPKDADGDKMTATFDTNNGLSSEVMGSRMNAGKQTMSVKDLKSMGLKIPKNKNELIKLLNDLNDMFM